MRHADLPIPIPTEETRAKRRRLAASHNKAEEPEEREEHIVFLDPLGGCEVFSTRRKARKFARRHRREIEAAFDW